MPKYLDETGLEHFWGNIRPYFDSITGLLDSDPSETKLEVEYVGRVSLASNHIVGAMTTDGTYVYVTQRQNDNSDVKIYRYSLSNFIAGNTDNPTIWSYSVTSHCNDLSYSGGYLYLTNWDSNASYRTVSIIDVSDGSLVKTISVPTYSQVNGFSISDNNHAIVFTNNTLSNIVCYVQGGILYPIMSNQAVPLMFFDTYAQGGTSYNNNFYKLFTGYTSSQAFYTNGIAYFNNNGLFVGAGYFDKDERFTNGLVNDNELQGMFIANDECYVIGHQGLYFKVSNVYTKAIAYQDLSKTANLIASYNTPDYYTSGNGIEYESVNNKVVVTKVTLPYLRYYNFEIYPVVGFGTYRTQLIATATNVTKCVFVTDTGTYIFTYNFTMINGLGVYTLDWSASGYKSNSATAFTFGKAAFSGLGSAVHFYLNGKNVPANAAWMVPTQM